MLFVKCSSCNSVWTVPQTWKGGDCTKCKGVLKLTTNKLFTDNTLGPIENTLHPARLAPAPPVLVEISQTTLPEKPEDVTVAYASALLDALVAESATPLAEHSQISRLRSLKNQATQRTESDRGVVVALAKAYLMRKEHRQRRKVAMVELERQSLGLSKQNKETEAIYRLTMEGEAVAVAKGDALAQGENSMDKYKWFYEGAKNKPLDNGRRTHRLTLWVAKGIIEKIRKMAVPHDGQNLQAAIVSRDVVMLKGRPDAQEQKDVLDRVVNEPGAFGVHEDCLEALSGIIKKREVEKLT